MNKFQLFVGVAISFTLSLGLAYLLIKRPFKTGKKTTKPAKNTTLGSVLADLNIIVA